jgi:hypothetical protein
MKRRLAEATKAWRARRTRGETLLCFFRAVEAAAVPLLLLGAEPCGVGVRLTAEGFAGVPSVGADVGDWDWAFAGGQEPSENRSKIPAKATTAKQRTQTLPTA